MLRQNFSHGETDRPIQKIYKHYHSHTLKNTVYINYLKEL